MILLVLAAVLQTQTQTQPGLFSSSPATFANPIHRGADPTIIWAPGSKGRAGKYAFSSTTGRGVRVWTAPTLAGMKDAEPITVYDPGRGTAWSENVWAPEFHYDAGAKRYDLLFAADDGQDKNHRMYALRSQGDNPAGPYDFKGEVRLPDDDWAIDGFLFTFRRTLYMFWSGRETGPSWGEQRIYVCRMKDSVTSVGPRVMLSRPEGWERQGWLVNEGPAAIAAPNGAVTLAYSGAGGTTPQYAIGRMFNRNGDLMNPKAWTKEPTPVFSAGAGMWATGHNSFFWARDGRPYIAFHAKLENTVGWGGRMTAVQPVRFGSDGRLDYGCPLGWDSPLAEPQETTRK